MKVILYIALGLVLLCGGALLWRAKTSASRQPTTADIQRAKYEGIVRKKFRKDIERAKAEGKDEIVLPPAEGCPSTVNSIEMIMRDYSLLRVKVIDKETTVPDPDADINTWYKFKVIETLQQQDKISDAPLLDGVPSRLLPLLPSECILIVSGGEITVDGVRVIRVIGDYGVDYIRGNEYLIASKLEYGGKVILPIAQAAGVFRIENTSLKPLGNRWKKLVREVEERYGNDLDNLRSGVH